MAQGSVKRRVGVAAAAIGIAATMMSAPTADAQTRFKLVCTRAPGTVIQIPIGHFYPPRIIKIFRPGKLTCQWVARV